MRSPTQQTGRLSRFSLWGVGVVAGVLLSAGLLAGCTGEQTQPKPTATTPAATKTTAPISWTHFDVPNAPTVTPELLARGKQVYENNCASCHGQEGTADGQCAKFLIPQPRNFTKGVFRFKTTPGGDLPTDQDLFRTISLGLHATGMPPWRYLLPEEDRWAVAEYIKTFSPVFERKEPGTPVELGQEPEVTPDLIARGKALYEEAQCAKCHGPQGYGDGPSAETLEDVFGNPIAPRNFHNAASFKRGHTLRDIALTIHTGNNGTPMPEYRDVFDHDQIWSIAAYVQNFGEKKLAGGGTPASATRGEHLGKPDVVIQIRERQWKFFPNTIRVKQGQIVRVDFQPSDNGLGVGHGFAIDGYDKSTFINGAMVQRPKSVTFVADKVGTFQFYCATQCSTGPLHPSMTGTFIVEPITN